MLLNIPQLQAKTRRLPCANVRSDLCSIRAEQGRAADADYGDFKGKPKCRLLLNNTASKHSCL